MAIVLLVALGVFRKPLTALIGRTVKVGLGGVGVEAQAPALPDQKGTSSDTDSVLPTKDSAPPSTSKADPRAAADSILASLPRNPYVVIREQAISRFLTERGITSDEVEAQRVLTGVAAVALVSMEFERIYGLIWGSQLRILQQLNGAPLPVLKDHLMPHYELAARAHPDVFARYAFDAYIGYLLGEGLAERKNDSYTITLRGRTFLLYLVNQGRSFERAG